MKPNIKLLLVLIVAGGAAIYFIATQPRHTVTQTASAPAQVATHNG